MDAMADPVGGGPGSGSEPTSGVPRRRSLGWHLAVWSLTLLVLGVSMVALPDLLVGEPGELEGAVALPSQGMGIAWVLLTATAVLFADAASTVQSRPRVARVFTFISVTLAVAAFGVYAAIVWLSKAAHAALVREGADAVRECTSRMENYDALRCLPDVEIPSELWAAVAVILMGVLVALVAVPGRAAWPASTLAGCVAAIPGAFILRFLITDDGVEFRASFSGALLILLVALVSALWWLRSRGIAPWAMFAGALVVFVGGVILVGALADAERFSIDDLGYTALDGMSAIIALLTWTGIGFTATHFAWLREERGRSRGAAG